MPLSGSDLIEFALAGDHFDPIAVFAPRLAMEIVCGEAAIAVLHRGQAKGGCAEA